MKSMIIRNFGPLKEITLDLEKQYNVLIGAQATGKSTAVKCVAFFSEIATCFGETLTKSTRTNREWGSSTLVSLLADSIVSRFMTTFSAKFYNHDTLLHCDYGSNMYIELGFATKMLVAKFSPALEDKLKDIFASVATTSLLEKVSYDGVIISTWVENIRKLLAEDEVVYIPAGRNTLSSMINANVFTKEAVGSFDFAVANFLKAVMLCKNSWNSIGGWGIRSNSSTGEGVKNATYKEFASLSSRILKGRYNQKKAEDYILLKGAKNIPITFASSGQQEALWIVNILQMLLLDCTKASLVIEEPEAHLYPDAQLALVKLVVLVANSTGSKIFVTTHSPYVLSAFNLLVHSGYVENNAIVKAKEKRAVIKDEYRIAPGELVANKIEDTGMAVNLLTGARCLVDIFAIDGVSEEISAYTDRLIQKEIRYDL